MRWRLGVATRLLGAPLRPHDTRRWQQHPHLSVSLAYVRDILAYCARRQIGLYRLSSTLAPYATHPDLPEFHQQRRECRRELVAIGDEARAAGVRLTMHPGAFVRLDAEAEGLGRRSLEELNGAAALFEEMGLGAESVLVVHAHGASVRRYAGGSVRECAGAPVGDGEILTHRRTDAPTHQETAALDRFLRRVDELPAYTRRRVVIENGDRSCDLATALWLQRRSGLPVVFDLLHHRCNNPAGLALALALRLALATWPQGVTPKVHLSSPRTELRIIRRAEALYPAPPLAHQHSDFINVFDCIELLRAAEECGAQPFDIMLEAKAHDLALLRLREQMGFFGAEFAGRVW